MCMGRAINGTEVSSSLAALSERYNLGEKGDEVVNALGKHRACLLYTSPSPRDATLSRMPSSA